MSAENASAAVDGGPSTSMVEITQKTQQTTAETNKELPEINEEKSFQQSAIKEKVVNEADAFASLEKLMELDMSETKFTSSEALQALLSLQSIMELNLSIPRLTPIVTSLQSLRELDLTHCGLKNLPDSLSLLKGLEQLNLSSNKFTSSETLNCVVSLQSLRELNLWECGLNNLPNSLSLLKGLEILDLSFNKFTSSETLNCVVSLQSLRELSLWDCGLNNLPDSLSHLKGLQTLNLSSNKFTSSEALNCVTSLQSLKKLNLWGCGLNNLPDSISSLGGLEKLVLSFNVFRSPEMLNCVTSLPSLRELDLSHCQLKNLPDSLSHLDQLRVLDLRNNCFAILPPPVCKLKNLEKLHLSYNEMLRSLDPEIQNMNNLKTINLARCPNLVEPPHDVCKKGSAAIRKYYRDKAGEDAQPEEAHDVLLTSSTWSHQTLSLEPSEATLTANLTSLKPSTLLATGSLQYSQPSTFHTPGHASCHQDLPHRISARVDYYSSTNLAERLLTLKKFRKFITLNTIKSIVPSNPGEEELRLGGWRSSPLFQTNNQVLVNEQTEQNKEGSLYGGEITLSTAQKRPFLVRIGDRVNTVSDNRKRKLSESSDEAEPDREHGVKRDEKKPLLGIVSLANKAVKLLPYMNIHKTMTEKSFCVDKVFHQPE